MKTHTVRMEWRVQHMIWPIWRFWVTTDHRRRRRSRRRRLRLCVDVVMSLAVEDPRGTTTLPSQTHTHTCAYQNPFWVTKSHVRESVFFRIGLRPVGSEPTARSRAIDQSWRWKSHAGPKSTTNTISPYHALLMHQDSQTVHTGHWRSDLVGIPNLNANFFHSHWARDRNSLWVWINFQLAKALINIFFFFTSNSKQAMKDWIDWT